MRYFFKISSKKTLALALAIAFFGFLAQFWHLAIITEKAITWFFLLAASSLVDNEKKS